MHNSDIDDKFQMLIINTSVEEIDNQHSMYIYIYILIAKWMIYIYFYIYHPLSPEDGSNIESVFEDLCTLFFK